MSLAAGDRCGPYEILGLVGAGGMGAVYRARDPRLRRDVAIKVVATEGPPSAERLRRFEDEARAVASLSHPNVLTVFDVGTRGDEPYVVFELLAGETLRERLRSGPLALRSAVEMGVQVCRGLQAAHARGILHRDLKPENLFRTSDGFVKILDFGLAKLTRGEGSGSGAGRTQTVAGVVMGTPGYLSPEQGAGPGGGRAVGHLRVGGDSLRGAVREAGVLRSDGGGHDLGDPARGPAAGADGNGAAAGAGGAGGAAVPGQGAGGPVPFRARPGAGAGGGAGAAARGRLRGRGSPQSLSRAERVHRGGRGALLRTGGGDRGAVGADPGAAAAGADRALGGGEDVFRAGRRRGVAPFGLGGDRDDTGGRRPCGSWGARSCRSCRGTPRRWEGSSTSTTRRWPSTW
jgi:hypothetical protein